MLYLMIIFGLLDLMFQDVIVAMNETKSTKADGRDLGDQGFAVDSVNFSSLNIERQSRLGKDRNRFRRQKKYNTDAVSECDYLIENDISGCQQTEDGCQKLTKISSSSGIQKCRNFTYWTKCPEESCPKSQQRSKNAPRLNHECGYQFIRGPCEWQQPEKSCSRNNVFKPTNQGENCNPLDFVESCNQEECDDSDQELIGDYETDSKPKSECVYRTSRDYCRYHVLQSQKEPSCVALETKSDESGRHTCPQEQNWATCQELECRKRCDALMAAWSPWRPCMVTCYSNDAEYASGIWPFSSRYRTTASRTAADDAKFCRSRETGICDISLPPCRFKKYDKQEATMIAARQLSGGVAPPSTWVFAVVVVFFIFSLGTIVVLVYFRHSLY